VYVAFHPLHSTASGIYKSADHGKTWSTLTTNLRRAPDHEADRASDLRGVLYLVSSPDMFIPSTLAHLEEASMAG